MKKALIVTTISGFVPQFEMNNVKLLKEMGYEIHYASNFNNPHYGKDNSRLDGTGIVRHQIDFVRSPFKVTANRKAYRQLVTLLEQEKFELIHCHTPMGGVLARLAAKNYTHSEHYIKFADSVQPDLQDDIDKTPQQQSEIHESIYEPAEKRVKLENDKPTEQAAKLKIIYTAHGFHFYKGAPLLNWLVYYPVERWLARYTDVLITINEEDYRRASRFRLRKKADGTCGSVYKVKGVGINVAAYRYNESLRFEKRKELGLGEEECLILSVGELTKRKNHQLVINALSNIKERCKTDKILYYICGEGPKRQELERLVTDSGLSEYVKLPGYCKDIKGMLAAADIFVFPSLQEGLPVALMEAKAAGLTCMASDIRGNRELLTKEYLFDREDVKGLAEQLEKALDNRRMQEYREELTSNSYDTEKLSWRRTEDIDMSEYDRKNIIEAMKKIYSNELKNNPLN